MRAVTRQNCSLPVGINFVFNLRALTRQNCSLPVGINFVVFNLRAVTKQSCCLPVKINCVLFNLKAVTEQSCSLPVWTQLQPPPSLQPPPPFTQRGTCFAGFCHISIKTAISQFLSLHPPLPPPPPPHTHTELLLALWVLRHALWVPVDSGCLRSFFPASSQAPTPRNIHSPSPNLQVNPPSPLPAPG